MSSTNSTPATPNTHNIGQGKLLDRHLGTTVRHLRQEHGLTIAEVSNRAGISRGMLSKIENGLTSTSLESLENLANALGVTMSRLFRDYNIRSGDAQLVKKGEGMEVVRRGTKCGHTYHLLAYDHGQKKTFEPFLITVEEQDEEFPEFEHSGTEFLYMLEGKLEYRVGGEVFLLEPGDSLTFHAQTPHKPESILETPVRFLAIINYDLIEAEADSED